MKRTAVVVGVLVAVVIGVLALHPGRGDLSDTSQPVRVAANLPITGPLALWGSSIREGGTMALEEQAPEKEVFKQLLEKRTDEILGDPRERLWSKNQDG